MPLTRRLNPESLKRRARERQERIPGWKDTETDRFCALLALSAVIALEDALTDIRRYEEQGRTVEACHAKAILLYHQGLAWRDVCGCFDDAEMQEVLGVDRQQVLARLSECPAIHPDAVFAHGEFLKEWKAKRAPGEE